MTNTFNIVEISKNDHSTYFVKVNGELVADSATMNRTRGFWNKKTGTYITAHGFTKKNIQKDPRIVLPFLSASGTDTTGGSWAVVCRF